MKYPPEWNMMVVLMVSSDEAFLDQMAEDICDYIRSCSVDDRNMKIIGPSAPVIKDRTRDGNKKDKNRWRQYFKKDM